MQRCNKLSSPGRRRARAVVRVLLAALGALSLLAGGARAQVTVDTREIYSSAAPPWLRAVGRLAVPGSRYRDGNRQHLREDCSATLVTRSAGAAADTIVTAWHCLEHYNDLSRPIMFTLLAGVEAAPRSIEAYRLADGGGMHADWALLRLRQPVAAAAVAALEIQSGRADPGQLITMAGFSRDPGKGGGGTRLTFDPACLVTRLDVASSESNCLAYKGASGGAVVQQSVDGEPRFSGVISAGDGAGVSTFVPVTAFRGAIGLHLTSSGR